MSSRTLVQARAPEGPQIGARGRSQGDAPREKAYPVDTSATLRALLLRSRREGTIEVAFRELVSWIKVGERATHYLHSYPAKLLPQIAHFFLAASTINKIGDTVLDPFAGTGTVPLEAALSGRKAYYADANPLARMIAEAKTTLVSPKALLIAHAKVEKEFKRLRRCARPDVVNLDYWYDRKTIQRLGRLQAAIETQPRGSLRDLLAVTFSMVARKASKADPRFSVPVRKRPQTTDDNSKKEESVDVWALFDAQLRANLERQQELRRLNKDLPEARCVGPDARALRRPGGWRRPSKLSLPNDSVGLIITSPPYAGAQKYIRASSLSLGWLGLAAASELRSLEKETIGREHLTKAERQNLPSVNIMEADQHISRLAKIDATRAGIICRYLIEMQDALVEAVRVLKPNGHLVLVIGDNEVCGEPFPTSQYLSHYLQAAGLTRMLVLVDDIKSRGLMTKRNRTAGMITREWVMLFRKEA